MINIDIKSRIIKLSDIKPYENNPRDNDNAVEYVANSIKQFGFKVPIIIDKNNEIVAGHTRVKASEMLGLTEVPCIIADDLTPQQIGAFRLAENMTHTMSSWDVDALNYELENIFDFDMRDFGFDLNEIRDSIPNFSNSEINTENFNDEKFEHECPKCGFKYN